MKYKAGFILLIMAVLVVSGCESKNENTSHTDSDKHIVIDDASVLQDDEKVMKMYRDYNEQMLKDFDIDFRIVTTRSEEDINTFANQAFAQLQSESRSKSGKALLLVVNPTQDKVRLEVSMALEPVYTDAYVSYVERKGMIPYLRDNKIADGVYMMTELARDRAYEARLGKEFMPPMESRSIGGGAKTKAYIGRVDVDAKKGAGVEAMGGASPKAVLQRYISDVLKKHNTNPELDIYTDTTKAFFRKWTVTEINQDHEVHNLAPCMQEMTILYDSRDSHAVLAVKPYEENRKCAPYFFKKEQGKWKLDIVSMAQVLRFNQNMQFHLDKSKRLEGEAIYYAFAFDGYYFDGNGYPHKYKKEDKEWKKYRWKYTCNGYYHPGDKKDDMHCWIKYTLPGGPADVRLGLGGGDKIYGFGEAGDRKMGVSIDALIDYLNSVPSGEVATVVLEHYYLNGKETYDFDAVLMPNVEIRHEIRQGIAP